MAREKVGSARHSQLRVCFLLRASATTSSTFSRAPNLSLAPRERTASVWGNPPENEKSLLFTGIANPDQFADARIAAADSKAHETPEAETCKQELETPGNCVQQG